MQAILVVERTVLPTAKCGIYSARVAFRNGAAPWYALGISGLADPLDAIAQARTVLYAAGERDAYSLPVQFRRFA